MNLYANKRLENLSRDNDGLGILDKADFIKEFFLSIKENNDLKMFCLYGDWGSGKSTLLKYLEQNLKQEYNTFFFEAWEHDHNDNIAYSLLEFLVSQTDDSLERGLNELLSTGWEFLKGFGKSVKVEVDVPLIAKVGFETEKLIEQLERKNTKTQLQLKNDFKIDFIKLEDRLTKEGKPKKNIVFIDDLDRCDPEQTLALLSAIKLFFTYGEKTLFICGIDKKAVHEAIKTKYHDYIKSSEYLEKIFDITFSMPKKNDTFLLFKKIFNKDLPINYGVNKNDYLANIASNFFKSIQTENPRKVKKILNKYSIIALISKKGYIKSPNIYRQGLNLQSFSLFETIYVLYLITLHEFYPDIFDDTLNVTKKIDYFENITKTNQISIYTDDILEQKPQAVNLNSFKELDNYLIYICFLPMHITRVNVSLFNSFDANLNITNHKIELDFYNYLFSHIGIDEIKKNDHNISLLEIKDFVSNML
ncbi:MAG: P-loop NTPase fold protein [Myroides sp.]|nr:P-loop NTPase fold protein [Myroides sp.]